ncbi:hypothetical protein DFP94_101777 [Fontibacillus phaseoli]|uniref:Uncharacterized protein n=1 Tax=Fontibacillus phaseoli TaxID=1416533 RepID=A0A369BNR3_9BACL|nr:GNAT family N-acetyltransferase [Fontibacillus phaseoli]RCX23183.1 hypothetical protein DFP94_101777 [Fontibacillus phaseoli]
MKNYFLKTARLGFSHWQHSDLDLAFSLWGEPAVTKFISSDGLYSNEQIKGRLIKEIQTEVLFRVQYWPAFELETNDFIGCCVRHRKEDL